MKKTTVNGKEYRSLRAACRDYKMSYCCVRDRIRDQGMTLEQALTVEVGYTTKAEDHLGNRFPTVSAMARAYGIRPQTLFLRLNQKDMSIKEALTTPVKIYKPRTKIK